MGGDADFTVSYHSASKRSIVPAFDDMSCNVQDLINLQKDNDQVLKLYYSSSELPNGRQLATVSIDSRQYNAAVITK
jgi:hypothetical protein